jgi:hypothetical protein
MGEWMYRSSFLTYALAGADHSPPTSVKVKKIDLHIHFPLLLLGLLTSWRWVFSFTPRTLSLRYPLNKRLDEPRSLSRRHGEAKILAPTGKRTLTSRSPSQSLYRLHYPGSELMPWLIIINEQLLWKHLMYLNIPFALKKRKNMFEFAL